VRRAYDDSLVTWLRRGRGLARGAAGVIALGLVGCATAPERPAEIGYLAPTGLPPGARSAVVQQPPSLVLGNLVDRLQQDSFAVTHLDEQRGLVVVNYSGDPEPYVDCGWIVAYQTGALKRIPAATASASFDRPVAQDTLELDRDLRLDGRMVVSLEPEGRNTVVSTDTTYVLTKTVDAAQPDGDDLGHVRETISFKTGESGTFRKGTQCQPNGRFERAVLDSLPATAFAAAPERAPVVASELPSAPESAVATSEPRGIIEAPMTTGSAPTVAEAPRPTDSEPAVVEAPRATDRAPPATRAAPEDVAAQVAAVTDRFSCAAIDTELGDGNTVRLSGYLGSEQDLERLRRSLDEIAGLGAVETDLEVHPWPFCELLAAIAPYRDDQPAPDLGLAITTSDRNTQLTEGDPLSLDIFLPPDARYLYLGYVQHDGRVGYITMMPVREWAESTGAIRFETGFQISEPFGREMIVAVTSRRPLFDQPRPAYEPASDYVAALQQRLAELRASDPDTPPAASHLFITTEPNPAS
jgi:hypothetical protein